MKHSMRALLVLLVIVQGVAFCFSGAAEGLPEITGIIEAFGREGLPVVVSDDGKETKYILMMNPSVPVTDMDVFKQDLRIAVVPKSIDQSTSPMEVIPTAVRGLPNLPVYAGLVERVDAEQGRLLARMQDGRTVWVAPHAGVDIHAFSDRGILFFLADGDIVPTSEADVANAVWSRPLDVYRGTYVTVKKEGIRWITLQGDAAWDTSDEGTKLVPYVHYEQANEFAKGDAVVALFDSSYMCFFGLMQDGA